MKPVIKLVDNIDVLKEKDDENENKVVNYICIKIKDGSIVKRNYCDYDIYLKLHYNYINKQQKSDVDESRLMQEFILDTWERVNIGEQIQRVCPEDDTLMQIIQCSEKQVENTNVPV